MRSSERKNKSEMNHSYFDQEDRGPGTEDWGSRSEIWGPRIGDPGNMEPDNITFLMIPNTFTD